MSESIERMIAEHDESTAGAADADPIYTVDIAREGGKYIAVLFDSSGDAIHDGTGDTPAEALSSLAQSRLVDWQTHRPDYCPRHGGPWGGDETCEECTDEDGKERQR